MVLLCGAANHTSLSPPCAKGGADAIGGGIVAVLSI